MKQFIRSAIVAIALLGSILGTALLPAVVSADTPAQTACAAVTGNTSCDDKSGGPSVNGIIPTTVNILSIVVGITAVIMIIVAGMRYITSGGDSNNTASAQKTLIYAVVGLVVVALAQFIVKFVLGKVK